MSSASLFAKAGGVGSLMPSQPQHDEAEFDITAMIDLVFMMNIFFMVTSLTAALAEIDLPFASHCVPADLDKAVTVTMVVGPDGREPLVYLGENAAGTPLGREEQDTAISAAIDAGVNEGHDIVIIKAEKNVAHKDVARVARIAAENAEVKLHLAVMETNK